MFESVSKAAWKSALAEYEQMKRVWLQDPLADVYQREKDSYISLVTFFNPPLTGRLLDIGCGQGKIRQFFPRTLKYVGVDPLATVFPGHDQVWEGTGEDLAFTNNFFNCVLIHSSLDHCQSPRTVLSEASRVLAPSGQLFLTCALEAHQRDHLYEFTEESLRQLIEEFFVIIRIQVGTRKSRVVDLVGEVK